RSSSSFAVEAVAVSRARQAFVSVDRAPRSSPLARTATVSVTRSRQDDVRGSQDRMLGLTARIRRDENARDGAVTRLDEGAAWEPSSVPIAAIVPSTPLLSGYESATNGAFCTFGLVHDRRSGGGGCGGVASHDCAPKEHHSSRQRPAGDDRVIPLAVEGRRCDTSCVYCGRKRHPNAKCSTSSPSA